MFSIHLLSWTSHLVLLIFKRNILNCRSWPFSRVKILFDFDTIPCSLWSSSNFHSLSISHDWERNGQSFPYL